MFLSTWLEEIEVGGCGSCIEILIPECVVLYVIVLCGYT